VFTPERVRLPVPVPVSMRFLEAPEMIVEKMTPPAPSMTIVLFTEFPRITPIVPVPGPVKVKFPDPEFLKITLVTELIVAPFTVKFPAAVLEEF
jgi:hypothetical protein